MKKVFVLLVLLLFLLINFETFAHKRPVLSIDKHGGHRVFPWLWVSYDDVAYNSADGSLKCRGKGVNRCHASIASGGEHFDIDDILFNTEVIDNILTGFMDNVDEITLSENSPIEGYYSHTYCLYDVYGNQHYVVFRADWFDSNWETGDAKINVIASVIQI